MFLTFYGASYIIQRSFAWVVFARFADKNIIYIKYKNYKEEISERRLEPIGLIFYAFSWHLIGYCHLRSSYRDFKVNNILQLNCSSLPFTLTEHISINDYMKQLPVDY